ncbi:hypothetical protein RHMOL_Rhmol07G0207700 [Rhododendron molle]|uniref:Uncharacterized protein n=1 Tax=Rhododendron molle TaxID=49168 RepID=A0ACC0N2V5_RHOML|nr:hypothetical protein RHMOL_Rhmol07G0207700 [Rhododendron molle]
MCVSIIIALTWKHIDILGCLHTLVYAFQSARNVIVVTSSLMKDMNRKTDIYRANAIRVLCCITDETFLTQIDRYFKQAIVEKNPVVASAALVSGIHVLQLIRDSKYKQPGGGPSILGVSSELSSTQS